MHFEPFEKDWKDEQMNDDDLYFFIDGFIYFDQGNESKANIHGYGGGAMSIYYKHALIQSIIV